MKWDFLCISFIVISRKTKNTHRNEESNYFIRLFTSFVFNILLFLLGRRKKFFSGEENDLLERKSLPKSELKKKNEKKNLERESCWISLSLSLRNRCNLSSKSASWRTSAWCRIWRAAPWPAPRISWWRRIFSEMNFWWERRKKKRRRRSGFCFSINCCCCCCCWFPSSIASTYRLGIDVERR